MRLIDAHDIEYEHICGEFRVSEEKINAMPTVCDIEQISSARYNNGFYDGKKVMEERIEQIRAEIVEYKDDKIIHAERNEMIDIVLEIIDRYKGE